MNLRTMKQVERHFEMNATEMNAVNITPDWVKVWTKEVAEQQLHNFQFKGPGWYFHQNGDTLLVAPTNDKNRFRFHVYNNRNPMVSFDWITRAPVQVGPATDYK